jgi:hypothetical protein
VEEAGGIYSWLFLEEAEGPDFSAVGEAHRAQAGEWLGSLQVAALQAGLESRLPARTTQYYLDLLRASREAIRGLLANPLVPVEDCAILCALVAEYDILEAHWHKLEAMCEGAPPTISHGDFATKNCRLRPGIGGEEFLVFDWEMAGWGVPAVDLAQATGGVVSPDLSAYSAVLRRHGIRLSPARLLRLAACGKVFRLLSVVAWACTWQENDSHLLLRKPLGSLRSFESRVAETLRTMQWAA